MVRSELGSSEELEAHDGGGHTNRTMKGSQLEFSLHPAFNIKKI